MVKCSSCRKDIELSESIRWFTSRNVEGRGCDYRYPKCNECAEINRPIPWDECAEIIQRDERNEMRTKLQ